MTVTFHLSDTTHKAAQKVARDLGFSSLSALIRWSLDETLQRQGVYAEARKVAVQTTGAPHQRRPRGGSVRARVEAMPPGQAFTADDVMVAGEDRVNVAVTLNALHRAGAISLRRSARRLPAKGWQPAVFTRRQEVSR